MNKNERLISLGQQYGIGESYSPTPINQLSNALHLKKFSVKDLGLSYRIVNHWSQLGIIGDAKDRKNSWRKFNTIEFIWVKLVMKLRKFGLPLKDIKFIKDLVLPEDAFFSNLEVHIGWSILNYPVGLVVFEESFAEVIKFSQLEELKKEYNSQSFIYIDLNAITLPVFIDYFNTTPLSQYFTKLSSKELKIFELIKKGNYEEIKVTYERGIPKIFYGKESVNNREKIIDILKSEDFQDILIKEQNGKIVKIKRTIKERL
jgi:DNA-binding transcriptional MerR regulator